FDLGLPVTQVMDLQQFDLVGLQALQRVGELSQTFLATVDTREFGCNERFGARAQLGNEGPELVLRIAVAWCSIDHARTTCDRARSRHRRRSASTLPVARRIPGCRRAPRNFLTFPCRSPARFRPTKESCA